MSKVRFSVSKAHKTVSKQKIPVSKHEKTERKRQSYLPATLKKAAQGLEWLSKSVFYAKDDNIFQSWYHFNSMSEKDVERPNTIVKDCQKDDPQWQKNEPIQNGK